ncbi:hypothetical protein CTA2_10500 [Colletotrichum tanaceti]|uniref:Wax synthase domain-containing protein n=1 Tax=Colletotrichum tanaceti TaxID=1306861 RepID=A0A4U6XDP0_9PEZI|nr:hypothetical protein CTA2_10500 [Colletotrichum tanaceti]TKW51967.1 hypothetical protein CTA1_12421 [Colletotrichum tanaceti]
MADAMDPAGAADYPNMTGDEQWEWSDYDMAMYADLYYPQHDYGEMSYGRALYTFFVWETWMSVRQIFTRELLRPVLLYALSVGCIAAALNVRGRRHRAAWVAASVAVGAVIVEYVARTDFVYVVKDTLVRLVVIHNLGAVVMILWERFCLTDEQRRLPWARRAVATYKIMWNSRFVNTARPAPVFHLLKAEEERQREILRTDTTTATADGEENKVVNQDGNSDDPNDDKDDGYFKKAWKTTRQVAQASWRRTLQPVSRLWNALTPKQRWIARTVAKITVVWALDRVLDQLADVYIDFDWWDIQLHKRSFVRRVREVSGREVVIRCYFAFQAVWGAFAFYTVVHSAMAVFFVGVVGIDEPDEWPPVFGDVRQAWNLRRFWSKYWDRLIYRAVNGLGEMLLTAVGLGGGGGGGDGGRPFRGRKRWLLNGLVFAISGVFHGFTDYFSGIRCSYAWEFWWWTANFAAVVAETALLHAVRTYFPRFYHRMSGRPGKALGFLWVFAWLFWAYPKSQFTTMHCLPDNR